MRVRAIGDVMTDVQGKERQSEIYSPGSYPLTRLNMGVFTYVYTYCGVRHTQASSGVLCTAWHAALDTNGFPQNLLAFWYRMCVKLSPCSVTRFWT